MSIWVYNANVANHRGVWHIAEDLVYDTYPGQTHTKEYPIYSHRHKTTCDIWRYGEERATYPSYGKGAVYVKVPCTCGRGDTQKVGTYTLITTYEDRMKLNCETACGQVSIRWYQDIEYHKTNWWPTPDEIAPGSVVEVVNHAKGKPYIFEGDTPPGPTCSRCLKKRDVSAQ